MKNHKSTKALEAFLQGYFVDAAGRTLAERVSDLPIEVSWDPVKGILRLPEPFIDDTIVPYITGLAAWKGVNDVIHTEHKDWKPEVWKDSSSVGLHYVLSRLRTLASAKNISISPFAAAAEKKEMQIRALLLYECATERQRSYFTPLMKNLIYGKKGQPCAIDDLVSLSRRLNPVAKQLVTLVCKLISSPDKIGRGVILSIPDSLPKQMRPKGGKGKREMVEINPFSLNSIRYLLPSEKIGGSSLRRNIDFNDILEKNKEKRRDQISDSDFEKLCQLKDEQSTIWFAIRRAARSRFDTACLALRTKGLNPNQVDSEKNLSNTITQAGVKYSLRCYVPAGLVENYSLDPDYTLLLDGIVGDEVLLRK